MTTDTTKITGAADELSAGLAKGGTAAKTLGLEIANAIKSLDERVAVLEAGETQPPTGGYDLSKIPFAPTSLWNKTIPAGRTFSNISWPASTGWNYDAGWKNVPIHVASPTDPVVQVTCENSWNWPLNQSLRIPIGAAGGIPTDASCIIIDGKTVYSFWRFNRISNTTATAGSVGIVQDVLTGTGWGTADPFQGAGITGAGSSLLGGMLVQAQTDTGAIKHAIQLCIIGTMLKPGVVPPAIHNDGTNANGVVQESNLLAIPTATPMPSGLSPLGAKVFTAFQQYGAYVIDNGGDQTAIRCQANAYDQVTMDKLRLDLNVIIPLLKLTR